MNRESLLAMLNDVREGRVAVEAAAERLRVAPLEDLGFARVDTHRALRCGAPEAIFSEGKTVEQLAAIFARLADAGQNCLATRVSAAQAAAVLQQFPEAEYDAIGRTVWLGTIPIVKSGRVAVVTAGTSDLPVAHEAYVTARGMACEVELIADVGVAGLHRLLRFEPALAAADAIVVVAGMEGALPSVVGGLVDCPVIAVPTSIGYGANFGGVAALLSMLNSCAANVAVVNIDAGFCAGHVAALIARRRAPRGDAGKLQAGNA